VTEDKDDDENMEIKKTNSLTKEEIRAIREVEEIVLKEEDLEATVYLDSSMNSDNSIPSFYLLYENNTLLSFLSLFIPEKEAEVMAFTHPAFRHQGYFTSLLKEALTELKGKVPSLLFTLESKSGSGKETLKHLPAATFSHAEYKMVFHPKAQPIALKEGIAYTKQNTPSAAFKSKFPINYS